MSYKEQTILKILPEAIKKLLHTNEIKLEKLCEIRLRINEPLIFIFQDGEHFLDPKKGVLKNNEMIKECYRVTAQDLRETVDRISSFSLYAYEDELKKGYITVQGGHRVGICGQVVLEGNRVRSVKHISFINIRVSHEIKGCGEKVLPYIYDGNEFRHTLIISPPGCGKTTLLRDVVRLISDGSRRIRGVNVGVVDERSEIAACYMGIPQNDVGIRTDILDCCPKAEGMLMLIRSMTPRVIAIDEIGKREDIEAISYIINCGCSIIGTVHGESIDDIRNKPVLRKLVEEKVFERFVVLYQEDGFFGVRDIFDERGNCLM